MPPCADGAALRQFVQALPRSSSTKTVMWATQAARSLRLATQATPGAVCVAGPERLRVLEPLLRYATALRAYGAETAAALPQASAWVLELPGARVTLGLSPEKARGSRARARCCIWSRAAMRMRTRRSCRRCWLSSRASISRSWPPGPCCPTRRSRPRWACWRLPAVGFDLAAGAYFHRPLPVQAGLLDTLHPRLAEARKLVAGGGVRREGEGQYTVQSAQQRYRIALGAEPAQDRCTCPWHAKYQGTRGPCKHTLAVRMFLDPLNAPGAGA